MNKQNEFERIKKQYFLKDSDFYFLDLIPLIQMIWVDGINQESELKILYKFVIEHISYLDNQAGLRFITIKQANDFLDRFAHKKPSDELLSELQKISAMSDGKKGVLRNQTIMEYCLDIAAACTQQYPYGMHERVVNEEKELLQTLFKELGVQADLIYKP